MATVFDLKDPDKFSSLLGGLAQAVMGEHKTHPAALAGQLAAGLGQAGIASKNVNEQRQQQQSFMKDIVSAVMGKPTQAEQVQPMPKLTPEGVPGPTSQTTKKVQNADGTFTETTELSGNSQMPGVNSPVQAPQVGPVAQPSKPTINPAEVSTLLPFLFPLRD